MNREIKFRAWDREEEKMYSQMYMLQAFPTNVLLDILLQDGMWDYNLMQYTGLKDKNGKEIYEGDIVKTGLDYPEAKVVWCNDNGAQFCCSLLKETVDEEGTEDEYKRPKGAHIEIGWYADDVDMESNNIGLEVIGNIYENPELLEENK